MEDHIFIFEILMRKLISYSPILMKPMDLVI